MDDIRQDTKDLLKELAPHIPMMTEHYYGYLRVLLSDAKPEEVPSDSAALAAVMSALVVSRGTDTITEKPANLVYASEILKIWIGVNKLMDAGAIEGCIEGVDEYGWPMYKIDNINDTDIVRDMR